MPTLPTFPTIARTGRSLLAYAAVSNDSSKVAVYLPMFPTIARRSQFTFAYAVNVSNDSNASSQVTAYLPTLPFPTIAWKVGRSHAHYTNGREFTYGRYGSARKRRERTYGDLYAKIMYGEQNVGLACRLPTNLLGLALGVFCN